MLRSQPFMLVSPSIAEPTLKMVFREERGPGGEFWLHIRF
jgi:hypothetical protein